MLYGEAPAVPRGGFRCLEDKSVWKEAFSLSCRDRKWSHDLLFPGQYCSHSPLLLDDGPSLFALMVGCLHQHAKSVSLLLTSRVSLLLAQTPRSHSVGSTGWHRFPHLPQLHSRSVISHEVFYFLNLCFLFALLVISELLQALFPSVLVRLCRMC